MARIIRKRTPVSRDGPAHLDDERAEHEKPVAVELSYPATICYAAKDLAALITSPASLVKRAEDGVRPRAER